MAKLFGTDGVRGVANIDVTPDLALRLGQGYGSILFKENERKKVVLGSDTRISKDIISCAVASGIMSSGVDVINVGILPTPAIANLIKYLDADGGVVISASHNSFGDNGIKFFNEKGFKLDDDLEFRIEELLASPNFPEALPVEGHVGRLLEYDVDYEEIYIKNILDSVNMDLSGYKIALDCANGSAFSVAKKVYDRLGADVLVTNNEPTGININKDCGSTHLDSIKKFVVDNSCDLGIAYDGDADRVILIDELGSEVDGDIIIGLCARHLKSESALKNSAVVLTVMSNMGIHQFLKDLGCDVHISSVGDRNVIAKMLEEDIYLGGEQSGHIIFLDHSTTGDGVLSSVKFMEMFLASKKPLSELVANIELYPQVLENIRVPNDKKKAYLEYDEIRESISKAEEMLSEEGRVLIRPSGTEPLIRVMAEGKDRELIKSVVSDIISVINRNLNC